MEQKPESGFRRCRSCNGTGEMGMEAGVVACPDCGGEGTLPSPGTLVEWRLRDIERVRTQTSGPEATDFRWLIAELRRAREALTEIVALAQDEEVLSDALHQAGSKAARALSIADVPR